MLRKLKELQQTCCVLNKLYRKYYYIYPEFDFRLAKLDFNIPYTIDKGELDGFLGLDFSFSTCPILGNEIRIVHKTDPANYVLIELIGKPKNEIEKWYKQKVEDLKEKQAEEQATKVYAIKL